MCEQRGTEPAEAGRRGQPRGPRQQAVAVGSLMTMLIDDSRQAVAMMCFREQNHIECYKPTEGLKQT